MKLSVPLCKLEANMNESRYRSMPEPGSIGRRDFLRLGGASAIGALALNRTLLGQEGAKAVPETRPQTNIADALKVPRGPHAIPGPFPGRVVEIHDEAAMAGDKPAPVPIRRMVKSGIETLTGKSLKKSFPLFFTPGDVVGIKVNPVGAGLISTRLEVVDALVEWLRSGGIPAKNIVIWDRFDYMLTDAGFTSQRFPGVTIEGLQTMDEAAAEGKSADDSRWLRPDGHHISEANFDLGAYYYADVEAPQDKAYLNQHVFNGKYSYFGKLLTRRLTKIINVPVFKNTGNGVSMATKNLGYGAICNTNRLHRPLFFDVCTEVLAFPVIRDKLVLNVTDALRAQYDGGPMPLAQAAYLQNSIFFATDPFALDMICHNKMLEKRKAMGVKVNEHPKYTEYLRYGEKLGLGVAAPEKITVVKA
jgi:hypothetical protein